MSIEETNKVCNRCGTIMVVIHLNMQGEFLLACPKCGWSEAKNE